MKKYHVKNEANGQPVCGVAITDAKLEFLSKEDGINRYKLGQARTCQRCAKIIIKAYHG